MSQRGVTLLELLIATFISTLVLGSALWILSGGLDAEGRIQKRELASQELMVIVRRLEHELRGSYTSELVAPLSGDARKIRFSYTTDLGLTEVVWESKEDGLYTKTLSRRAAKWSEPIKISGIWQGEFSYLDHGGGWKDRWDGEAGPPKAVRLELTGGGRHRLTVPLEVGRVIPY